MSPPHREDIPIFADEKYRRYMTRTLWENRVARINFRALLENARHFLNVSMLQLELAEHPQFGLFMEYGPRGWHLNTCRRSIGSSGKMKYRSCLCARPIADPRAFVTDLIRQKDSVRFYVEPLLY